MMPLLNSSFEPGEAKAVVEAMEDGERKEIALAELYYFQGKAEKTQKLVIEHLNSNDISVRLSALLLFTFSSLALGHIHESGYGLEQLKMILKKYEIIKASKEDAAMSIFFWTTAMVLLHIPKMDVPPLMDYIRYLPEGMQIFAIYVVAHQLYLEGDYSRSLGICESCLAMKRRNYPIAENYMRIIMAVSLMGLKRTEEAKKIFLTAWENAKKDQLLECFGEHHGLLQGLIEACLKKDYSEEYRNIVDITYKFSAGWRKVHNPITNANVADNLTTTEFSIAMLASRRWTNIEIADYMHLSEHTVKKYVSDIYQKLGISSRKELHQFMLQ